MEQQIASVRRFNRLLTRKAGALEASYLSRGRPLAEARVIFEIGPQGLAVAALRQRLGLDSGYLSRLLRSLEKQGLVELGRAAGGDGRRRQARLTASGRAEFAFYDAQSDRLAASWLEPLSEAQRARLTAAMAELERLLRLGSLDIRAEAPGAPAARFCRDAYFAELARRFEAGFDMARGGAEGDAEMAPPAGLFFVARLEGEPVGCGGVKFGAAGTAEIKRMWTAPQARGLGVARRLLRCLEDAARRAGCRAVRLDTNRALAEAQALYRGEGFAGIARYNDNPYADFWFEKAL